MIRHGQLITPAGPIFSDLAIDQDKIASIGAQLNGARSIDATGCYVIPGGVDCHVHLQMSLNALASTDSFETGTVAAACGGTTTVVDFTDPQPEQPLMEALRNRKSEADGRVAVDYGLHMTIPTWHASSEDRLHEIPAVVESGCATFKLYQAYNRMQLDDVALLRAMRAVASAGGGVVLHSETGPLLDELRADAVAAGHTQPLWHERTRPARLEASAVQRAVEIAALANCPLHIFHVGSAESLAQVTAARKRGLDITVETCPHYLLLTADEHLAGSEAHLALVHHFGVIERALPLTAWVSACCTAPARRMGLSRKGNLLPGYDANIVIFDPDRKKTLRANDLNEEAADWTPYEGKRIVGWPRTVLLGAQKSCVTNRTLAFQGKAVTCIETHILSSDPPVTRPAPDFPRNEPTAM